MTLTEADVFRETLDLLCGQGHQLLVHIPGSQENKPGYKQILEEYEKHNISIQGRYPDILGRAPTGRIIAIEVKGEKDILKGLGQALVYRRGSHRTYIAAESETLSKIENQTTSQSIGEIRVFEEKRPEMIDPTAADSHDFLQDVGGQLKYHLEKRNSVGQIAGMDLAQPVNFLAPSLAIEHNDVSGRKELEKVLESDFKFSGGRLAVDGAETLGLVNRQTVDNTDQGEIAVSFLRGQGITSLDSLRSLKQGSDKTLHQKDELIAEFLCQQYCRHPEFSNFIEVIESFSTSSILLSEVIERILANYPNLFPNLFCPETKREEAEEFVRLNAGSSLSQEDWISLIRQNIVHNFTSQLRHLGILLPKTSAYSSSLEDFSEDQYPWKTPMKHSWF